jgi:hypothetical protein
MSKNERIVAIVFVVIVIGIPVYLSLAGPNMQMFKPKPPTPIQVEEENQTMAYVCAVDGAREKLKAPSTAKFASITDSEVINKNGLYYVKAYVDSQNGFGAMLRTAFICTMPISTSLMNSCPSVNCVFENN